MALVGDETETRNNLVVLPAQDFTGGSDTGGGYDPVSRSDADTVLATERYEDDDDNDVLGTPVASGTLNAIDADVIASDGRRDAEDRHTFFIVAADASNALQGLDDPDTAAATNPRDFVSDGETDPLATDDPTTSLKGTYGTLTLNAFTGAWVYHLDNTDPDTIALRASTATDAFWIRITDEEGATLWRQLTVTINPTDDARIIFHEDIADIDVLEAGGTANGTAGDARVSGTVTSNDDDASAGDVFSVRISDDIADPASFTNWGARTVTGKYGSVTLTGSSWEYVLDDSNAAVQALDPSDIVEETFELQYRFDGQTDNAKDSNTITIVVTITGANDAPTLTQSGFPDVQVTEDHPATGTGRYNFGDVDGEDGNDTLLIHTAHAASSGGAVNAHTVPADPTNFSATNITDGSTVKGAYGTFSFARNDTTGRLTWTYTLDDTTTNTALNRLHDGQLAYDKLAVRVNDGTLDSNVEIILIAITGTNDAPEITGVSDGTLADVTNDPDNTPTVTGNFGVTDPDEGEQEGGARAPTYAIITGSGSDAATVSAGTGTAPNLTYTVTRARARALSPGAPSRSTPPRGSGPSPPMRMRSTASIMVSRKPSP